MNRFVFFVVLAVMAGGLFYVYKTLVFDAETPASASTPKVFSLVVEKRRLVSGPYALEVRQGDQVTINITVDEPEELHLHGYDLHADLEKGKQGSLSFTASASGRFPYELENSKTEIGALEVQP